MSYNDILGFIQSQPEETQPGNTNPQHPVEPINQNLLRQELDSHLGDMQQQLKASEQALQKFENLHQQLQGQPLQGQQQLGNREAFNQLLSSHKPR